MRCNRRLMRPLQQKIPKGQLVKGRNTRSLFATSSNSFSLMLFLLTENQLLVVHEILVVVVLHFPTRYTRLFVVATSQIATSLTQRIGGRGGGGSSLVTLSIVIIGWDVIANPSLGYWSVFYYYYYSYNMTIHMSFALERRYRCEKEVRANEM